MGSEAVWGDREWRSRPGSGWCSASRAYSSRAFLALFGFGIYMFTQHVDWDRPRLHPRRNVSSQARMQFEGEVALMTITGGHGLEISRREEQSHAKAEALHVLTWDPDDERLVSLSIPFWLLRRMGRGTINLSGDDDDPLRRP